MLFRGPRTEQPNDALAQAGPDRDGNGRRGRRLLGVLVAGAVLVVVLPGAAGVARADGGTTVTFAYSGAAQTWTVPAGVTSVQVTAEGAQGDGSYAGLGGRAQATLAVTPGSVLNVYVGGQGSGSAGGFNGGGGGNFGSASGAGGGASDIRIGGTALSNRVLVAGGGGGAGLNATPIFGAGGSAGGLVGEAGTSGDGVHGGGGGGTQTAGGASGGSFGSAGSLGQGAGNAYRAGDGGGGYYGGGSGGSDANGGSPGGGGGGSSYADPAASSVSYLQGYRAGNGKVTVTYPPSSDTTTPTPGSATFGYTGGPQTWTVPAGVTSIGVQAYAAQGQGSFGGFGAMARAEIPVTPGQTLTVVVGGQGVGSSGGFNGGGGGNTGGSSGAGGGASDVRGGGVALADRLLIAGGGGGAGAVSGPVYGQGGSAGQDGTAGGDGDGAYHGGGGGSQTAGGGSGGNFGAAGRLGQGAGGAYQGGDGGGGYYGGGSGGSDASGGSPGGGGAGSSFATASASGVSFIRGARRGDGQVTITWPPAAATVPEGSSGLLHFSYTGGPEFIAVPAGASSFRVSLSGGQGANGSSSGGKGGVQQGLVPVVPGQIVTVIVAGQGSGQSGGFNGGGGGNFSGSAGAGGGASDIRVGGLTLADRVLVASGGGGGADGGTAAGGDGGGQSGQDGGHGSGQWAGGGGGSQSAGGAAGGDFGKSGALGQGAGGAYLAGDGGGGFYGGGSGGSQSFGGSPGGGGGGSSFAAPSVTEAATQSGVQSGNGSAIVDTGTVPLARSRGVCDNAGAHAIAGSVCTGDPVNSLTGAFTDTASDLTLAATGVPFAFTRSYTSADPTAGRLGPGWTDNYAVSLAVQPNGDAILHGDEGQLVTYAKQADGSFLGAAGALSTLTAISGDYKLVRHDQVSYTFNSSGVLQSETDRNGQGLSFGYDGSGRLSTITDSAGHLVTLGYNADNTLSTVSTPDSRIVGYGYTSGRLTSVTLPDPDGTGPLTAPVWTYTYDAGARLWQVIDPNNQTPQITNVYDPTSGRVTQQTDANSKTTGFAWDAATQTATITDANNHIWKDIYQNNLLIKRIDPAGEVTQFGHDFSLDTNAVTSPNGNDTTSLSYQNGNLMSATAPASLSGVQKIFTYDSQNNVKTVTDARSKVTQYGYNTAGNNDSITLDGQQVFGATYNAQGQMLTSTDGNQKQTTYTYDANGNLASVTAPDPDGIGGPLEASRTTYTYDTMGNVLSKVDPLGNCTGCTASNYTTTYTYDKDGRLLTETDPLGNCAGCNPANHTTTYTYDAAGNKKTVTDASGHTTSYDYDNANHLFQVTGADPDGAGPLEAPITKYTYDDVGNRLTMVGPRGNCGGCNAAAYTTTYTYDQNNRLASVTTPKGEKTTYSYDDNGNLATVVEPRGNAQGANPNDYKTSYGYDAAGRLLTTTSPDPDGAGPLTAPVTTKHYDVVGNLDWMKDANQHQTSYSYDAAGRILTVTGPDTGLTTYTYDGNGNLRTRRDDNTHTTTYTYDDAGRLTQVTGQDPDGAGSFAAPVTSHSYDLNSNLATTTDPNGNATQTVGDGTTTYAYDHANRLTGIDYSDTTPDVTFDYDNIGNRTSMSDSSGSANYVYDNLNRLTSLTRGSDSFSYVYDVAGDITSRTYPDNTATTYTYDEDNRLSSATSGAGTTNYLYDEASHLKQTTLPSANGYVETRNYDNVGRLTEVKNQKGTSTLSDYLATLDPVGNPTQIMNSGATPGAQTFSYDANDRLLSVCFQTGTCPNSSDPFTRWTYDKVGNRLTETRAASSTTYNYNAGDELTSTVKQTPGQNPYSGQVQTDGAQPYWRLGEASGSSFASTVGSFTGTWSGSPTLGAAGALNGDANTAVTLNPNQNQNTQWGTVASATQLNKSNNFSLELWVKRSRSGVLQAVAGKPLTTTAKNENYAIWIDSSNQARFEVGNGTKSTPVTCTAHPLDTGWHHIVGTFASGAMKIYYDGSLCNSATATFTAAATNTSTFDVGRSGTTNYYGGSLDEIALYGTALTATQVPDHFNKGNSTPPPTQTTTNYGYDNDGNETAVGSTTLSYDLANRLKTLSAGGTTSTYSYDGDGSRLQTSTGASASQKTNYLWDTNQPLAQLALERDGNNTLLRRYIYGAHRVSMTSGGNTYYYHYDPLGSVTNLTNAAGATQWTTSYEPYGPVWAETHDPSAPTNPFKFTGEYLDPIDSYYLRARQYSPTTGTFLTTDPIATEAGRPYGSRYAYVDNRPTTMVDPSGKTGKTLQASDKGRQLAFFATNTDICIAGTFVWECDWPAIDWKAFAIFTIASLADRTPKQFRQNGPYWHYESDASVILLVVESRLLQGSANRDSNFVSVDAYTKPIANLKTHNWVEFTTPIPPQKGSAPIHARWILGTTPGVTEVDGRASIPITVLHYRAMPKV